MVSLKNMISPMVKTGRPNIPKKMEELKTAKEKMTRKKTAKKRSLKQKPRKTLLLSQNTLN